MIGRRFISCVVLVAFLLNSGIAPIRYANAQELLQLPQPGTRVSLSPAFLPPLLKGVKVYPDNPFKLDFILDKGDSVSSAEDLKTESTRMIKYFLASITVPENDLWVNLSPYEKDRIIPDGFGMTEMGRDLLAQDYMLKQITASVIYPEEKIGREFWNKVYTEAQRRFGSRDVPVDTVNKVWIVPEKAVVYENKDSAYVVESRLKVLLEEDYLALEKGTANIVDKNNAKETNSLGAQIVREVVIPILEKEVNEGKNFAQLRQVYHSLILALWFKDKIRESILGQAYVDRDKVSGVDIADKTAKEKIWSQYVEAFKKGAYNYIKEDYDAATQQTTPRKYFSGGAGLFKTRGVLVKSHDRAQLPQGVSDRGMKVQVGLNAVSASLNYPSDEAPANRVRDVRETFVKAGVVPSYSLWRGAYDMDDVRHAVIAQGLEHFLAWFKNGEAAIPASFEVSSTSIEDAESFAASRFKQVENVTYHLRAVGKDQINLANLNLKDVIGNPQGELYQIVNVLKPTIISLHLGWCCAFVKPGGEGSHDLGLSPVLERAKLIDQIVGNLKLLKENLQKNGYSGQMLIETLDYHKSRSPKETPDGLIGPAYEYVTDPEFILEVVKKSGFGLLIDFGHLLVSAKNTSPEVSVHYMDYVRKIVNKETIGLVGEVHIAVPVNLEHEYDDTHRSLRTDDDVGMEFREISEYFFRLRKEQKIATPLVVNFETEIANAVDEPELLAGLIKKSVRENDDKLMMGASVAENIIPVRILNQWEVGSIEEVKFIKNGRWFVTTRSGKKYVLKDLGLDMKPKDKKLPWELSSWGMEQLIYAVDLQNYLANELNGLVPPFLAKEGTGGNRFEDFYVQDDNAYYFLESVMPGSEKSVIDAEPGVLAEIGMALAKFHNVTAEYVPKGKESQEGWPEYLYSQANRDVILDVVRNQYPDKYEFVQEVIKEFLNHTPAAVYRSLPSAIIHGDTNISNFLFDANNHISGIIDVLDAGRTPRIVDFTSILFKARESGKNAYYNRNNIEELIRGYQSLAKQPLSDQELQALPYFLLLEPLSFFMRLHYFGQSKYSDDLCNRVVEYMKDVLRDVDNGFYQNIAQKYSRKSVGAVLSDDNDAAMGAPNIIWAQNDAKVKELIANGEGIDQKLAANISALQSSGELMASLCAFLNQSSQFEEEFRQLQMNIARILDDQEKLNNPGALQTSKASYVDPRHAHITLIGSLLSEWGQLNSARKDLQATLKNISMAKLNVVGPHLMEGLSVVYEFSAADDQLNNLRKKVGGWAGKYNGIKSESNPRGYYDPKIFHASVVYFKQATRQQLVEINEALEKMRQGISNEEVPVRHVNIVKGLTNRTLAPDFREEETRDYLNPVMIEKKVFSPQDKDGGVEISTIDLQKAVIGLYADADVLKRDFVRNPPEYDEAGDAKEMGLLIGQFAEDALIHKGRRLLMAFNGAQPHWESILMHIVNGRLEAKEWGSRGVNEKEFHPVDGEYWFLSLDHDHRALDKIEIRPDYETKTSKMILPEGLSVKNAIGGVPLIQSGKSVISKIKFGDGKTAVYGGEELLWPQTQRMAMSAIGYNKDGELVRVAVFENITIDQFVEVLMQNNLRDAILLGTSADVKTWNNMSEDSKQKTHTAWHRPGSFTGEKESGLGKKIERPLGTYIAVYAKEDSAMGSPGGIDLTRDKMNIQTRGDGNSIQFNSDPAMIQQLQNASGLTPVIINIHPMTTSVPMFLGLKEAPSASGA